MNKEKSCLNCEKVFSKNREFSYKTWKSIKYCSRRCCGIACSQRQKGVHLTGERLKRWVAIVKKANKERKAKDHWHWKGGRNDTVGGYVEVYMPNYPNVYERGYVLEHRLVMGRKLNRVLNSDEIVHHINGDKKDNRLENLELTTRTEHPKIHFKGIRRAIFHNLKK